MDFDCPARTVKEEVLQGAIITAINDAYARRNAVISLLKKNIQETVCDDLEARIVAVDEQLAELQQKMVDNSCDNALVDELGFQVDEMPAAITEYSEALARRLVDRITIFNEKIVVELKSGLTMEVEE